MGYEFNRTRTGSSLMTFLHQTKLKGKDNRRPIKMNKTIFFSTFLLSSKLLSRFLHILICHRQWIPHRLEWFSFEFDLTRDSISLAFSCCASFSIFSISSIFSKSIPPTLYGTQRSAFRYLTPMQTVQSCGVCLETWKL